MTDADASDALPEPEATTPEPAAAETTETPATETPAAVTAEAPAPAADAAPTVEAPATPTAETPTATVTEPVTAVPVAPAPAAAAPTKPAGIHVPVWVAAVVGALVVFALGLGIGYAVGDDHDGGNRSVQAVPGFNGQMPNGFANGGNGGQFGQGNGQMPFGGNGGNGQMPFGRNGNGNGNGNGNNGGNGGSGGSTTAKVFLGVAAQDSTNPEGAELVRVVAGSPAADAGLKTGDVITKFDGTSITTSRELTTAVRSKSAGDQVTITYVRDGQTDTTQATLAGSPEFSRQ